MNILIAFIPLAALIFLLRELLIVRPSTGTIAWIAPQLALLAFLAVWTALGLVSSWPFDLVVGALGIAGITLAGMLTLQREKLCDQLETRLTGRISPTNALAGAALLAAFLALEVPWNWLIPFGGPLYFWLEMGLIGLVMAAGYYLCQRRAQGAIFGLVASIFIGLMQFFVRRFKNSAILPTDLYAVGTAAAVSGGYSFSLDGRAILGLGFFALGLSALSALSLERARAEEASKDKQSTGLLTNLAKAAASVALLVVLIVVPNYMNHLGVQIMYWYSIDYYQQQGFLPTFIAIWQDLPIKKPANYNDELAKETLARYAKAYQKGEGATPERKEAEAQFEQLKPSIVVIMNESFADLSVYDQLKDSYKGPQYFKNEITDAVMRGKLAVSVTGGGTCNSEFEFLTGNATAFIGAGKYPYSIYQLDGVDAMAAQLKAQGYTTTALHPNYASNWNRNTIYPLFGFDRFLSIDDFGGQPETLPDGTRAQTTPDGTPIFHSGMSDEATYDRILQLLEEDASPHFVFDVTMQNHGAYDQNNIPADKLTQVSPPEEIYANQEEETPERLNEYLSCIEESDRALKAFMEKLKQLERPVVLVFFGDHQPTVSAFYNDLWFADEPEIEHINRLYSSDYLVWANYNIAGRTQTSTVDDTSVDYLGAMTLNAIGAPLSSYDQARLAIREELPALNLFGYQGSNRTWYANEDESPYRSIYNDLALIEYLNFATKVR